MQAFCATKKAGHFPACKDLAKTQSGGPRYSPAPN
jgi:hypothetical protein